MDNLKFCKDCKHYERNRIVDTCSAIGPRWVDPINGWKENHSCGLMRSHESECGEEGKLFEQKVAWYKFWK